MSDNLFECLNKFVKLNFAEKFKYNISILLIIVSYKMSTTIQISDNVKQKLENMNFSLRETYNEIIVRMLEDEIELNEQTKKEIEERRKGKSIPHEDIKRLYGL